MKGTIKEREIIKEFMRKAKGLENSADKCNKKDVKYALTVLGARDLNATYRILMEKHIEG